MQLHLLSLADLFHCFVLSILREKKYIIVVVNSILSVTFWRISCFKRVPIAELSFLHFCKVVKCKVIWRNYMIFIYSLQNIVTHQTICNNSCKSAYWFACTRWLALDGLSSVSEHGRINHTRDAAVTFLGWLGHLIRKLAAELCRQCVISHFDWKHQSQSMGLIYVN